MADVAAILDQLRAAGASAADCRDAAAILALTSVGIPIERLSMNKAPAYLSRLDLRPDQWPRVAQLLEAVGAITRIRHNGRVNVVLTAGAARAGFIAEP